MTKKNTKTTCANMLNPCSGSWDHDNSIKKKLQKSQISIHS